MLKSIQIKLNKVKYIGDSIGDDVRIEVEILGKFLQIDKEIKVGKTTTINQVIGDFETDQEIFRTGVLITIIEKDLLFNDVGSIGGSLKINTIIIEPQQFVFQAQVKETRSVLGKIWGKRNAYFEITLEVEVLNAIKYVPNEGDGWLKVILQNNGKTEALPAYLKVKINNKNNGREYFTILEGPYRGRIASIELNKNGSSQLISNITNMPMVLASYSISQKILVLNGKKYQATDHPDAPLEKRLYDIEMPDAPHRGGVTYLDKARLAKIWFRIGHSGSRYLHTGRVSLGCLTIIEVEKWDTLCETLLKARKDDSMSVGILEVID